MDQHLIFTSGICKAIVGGEEKEVKAGDLVIVPQGTKHNCESSRVPSPMGPRPMLQWLYAEVLNGLTAVINTGPTPLCLFTVYAPAEHAEDTVHKTKEEGDEAEEAGKDEAPEWSQKH